MLLTKVDSLVNDKAAAPDITNWLIDCEVEDILELLENESML